MDEDFSNGLRNAKTVEEFLQIIGQAGDDSPACCGKYGAILRGEHRDAGI